MLVSVVVSRVLLFILICFGIVINQFSSQQIESFIFSIPYRCPLKLITGWKCAFCGMTHSWIAIFQGEFSKAFQENVLGPVLWLMMIIVLISYSLNYKISFNIKRSSQVMIVILLFFAVLRNLI